MDIPRLIEKKVEDELGKQKVIMLYGTRRVGKTTIIENIAARHGNDVANAEGDGAKSVKTGEERLAARDGRANG